MLTHFILAQTIGNTERLRLKYCPTLYLQIKFLSFVTTILIPKMGSQQGVSPHKKYLLLEERFLEHWIYNLVTMARLAKTLFYICQKIFQWKDFIWNFWWRSASMRESTVVRLKRKSGNRWNRSRGSSYRIPSIEIVKVERLTMELACSFHAGFKSGPAEPKILG